MSKKLKRPNARKKLAEVRLRELQRAAPRKVRDLQDLRQPILTMRRPDAADYVYETFVTYGAYQDPF